MATSAQPQLKILVLAPFAPRLDAPHGGGRVIAQLVAGLAARHQVGILFLRAPEESVIDERLAAACTIVQEVLRPGVELTASQRWQRRVRLIWGWCRGRPMLATDWAVSAYHQQLRQVLRTWRPDIIQCEFHLMGQYLHALPSMSTPFVLTEHEPGMHAAQERTHAADGWRKLMHVFDQWAWQHFEPAVVRLAQAVIVFTEQDRRVLQPIVGATPVHCIPFGTTIPKRPLSPGGTGGLSVLFVGSFVHPPNVDAALALVESIFPRVLAQVADVKLFIVGDQPPPDLQRLANDNVIITGFVPDVVPYLDQAAVVVVPLRQGGGMRVKVLEALAAGKAIVASPLAIAGLNITHHQIMLATTDTEFAAMIIELLHNPDQRARLAAEARRWAEQHLGGEATVAAYEQVYTQLVARRS